MQVKIPKKSVINAHSNKPYQNYFNLTQIIS